MDQNLKDQLVQAVRDENLGIIKDLTANNNIDLNERFYIRSGVSDQTLLMYASYLGRINIVKFLSNCGVDMNLVDLDGRTALHLAAHNGQYATVQFLVEEAHVDIFIADETGYTAKDRADLNNYYNITDYLGEQMDKQSHRLKEAKTIKESEQVNKEKKESVATKSFFSKKELKQMYMYYISSRVIESNLPYAMSPFNPFPPFGATTYPLSFEKFCERVAEILREANQ